MSSYTGSFSLVDLVGNLVVVSHALIASICWSSYPFQTHKGTSITSLLSCIYSPELSFKPTRVRPLPTRNRVVIVLYMLFLQNIFRRPPITLSPLGGSTEIVGFSVSLLYFRKLWVVVTAVVYGVVVCYLYDLEIVEPVVFSSF